MHNRGSEGSGCPFGNTVIKMRLGREEFGRSKLTPGYLTLAIHENPEHDLATSQSSIFLVLFSLFSQINKHDSVFNSHLWEHMDSFSGY